MCESSGLPANERAVDESHREPDGVADRRAFVEPKREPESAAEQFAEQCAVNESKRKPERRPFVESNNVAERCAVVEPQRGPIGIANRASER